MSHPAEKAVRSVDLLGALEGEDARLNLCEQFLDARVAEGSGARIALIEQREELREYSYAQVLAASQRVAAQFVEAGVQREQRVAIVLEDGLAFVAALFATLRIGAVVVMINPDQLDSRIEQVLDRVRARAVVVEAGRDAMGDRHHFFDGVPTAARPESLAHNRHWSGLRDDVSEGAPAIPCVETHRDESAIWLFSGGTTGLPKVVMQSHRSFAYTTVHYAHRWLGLGPHDRCLGVPKLHFGYATGSNLLFPFSVGGSAVISRRRRTPEQLFDLIERTHPTVIVNVPSMVAKMVDHPRAGDVDMSGVRFTTSAGEALPAGLCERWRQRFGGPLLDGLGTAEMWHIFISASPDDVVPGKLGKVVSGFEVELRDDAGRPVGPGDVGWLWVRGGARALGYWLDGPATQAAFHGEWYMSGDMLRVDADGYFEHCGRGDDMLKVYGKWLAPSEVEACLSDHPSVEGAVVLGAKDARGLTRAFAFVRPTPGHRPESEALREHVSTRLERYKVPTQVYVVDQFATTHLGKADRAQLRVELRRRLATS